MKYGQLFLAVVLIVSLLAITRGLLEIGRIVGRAQCHMEQP